MYEAGAGEGLVIYFFSLSRENVSTIRTKHEELTRRDTYSKL